MLLSKDLCVNGFGGVVGKVRGSQQQTYLVYPVLSACNGTADSAETGHCVVELTQVMPDQP